MLELAIGIIVVFFVCALIGAWLAGEKGRGTAGFWLGLFFGPIGIVIALLLTPEESTRPVTYDSAEIADLKALLANKGKLGIVLDTADGRTIRSVRVGSAAHDAGIVRGDRLVSVDNILVDGTFKDVIMRLAGDPQTSVNLAVRRGNVAHEFTLVRR